MCWMKDLAASGANQMTFHYESTVSNSPSLINVIADMKELCNAIRINKIRVGIEVKPKIELDEAFFKLIDDGLIDMVLVMTVEPEFGGQKFMEETMPKVIALMTICY